MRGLRNRPLRTQYLLDYCHIYYQIRNSMPEQQRGLGGNINRGLHNKRWHDQGLHFENWEPTKIISIQIHNNNEGLIKFLY